jgi:hypothetical protein
MSNEQSQNSDSLDSRLADQLKREALADRPAFSAGLHDRMMAAIVASDLAPAAEPLPAVTPKRSLWRGSIPWAVVAAAILIAIFAIEQFRRSGGDPGNMVPHDRATDQVAQVIPHVGELTMDDLDRTAGVALRFVVDQLPIDVPADDWGLPAVN